MVAEPSRPAFPPGFWRRIVLHPHANGVIAALEDDVHRFHLRLEHNGERITRLDTWEPRVPYTTCPGAGPSLRNSMIGLRLDVLRGPEPREHCTHLHDLALLAASYAGAAEPVRFDMQVGDRQEGSTRAQLFRDGREVIRWDLDGTGIVGPDPWSGRDLRRLSAWQVEFDTETARQLVMLRRTVLISGARRHPTFARASDHGPQRLGACYTHQAGRAEDALRASTGRIDFSDGVREPLQDFEVAMIAGPQSPT